MKKSELKKELEVAKATLELAMVALRVAAEKNNLKSSIKPPMIPIYQLKRLMDKFKKNQTIIPNPEPQAGDKIVEGNKNTDWFIKNDDGSYTIKLGTVANFVKWDNQLKKETPLANLNKEVQEFCHKHTEANREFSELSFEEKEEINRANYKEFTQRDKSFKQPETSKDESYVIQAKEAVDKFMPLVTGWRANDPCGLMDAQVGKTVWSYNKATHRKAAINCAIEHFELIQKQGGWLTHIECVQIIGELQKMLAS